MVALFFLFQTQIKECHPSPQTEKLPQGDKLNLPLQKPGSLMEDKAIKKVETVTLEHK